MGEASRDVLEFSKNELFGWKMYDWAWSAFSTTIAAALLGPYLFELADDKGGVLIGGDAGFFGRNWLVEPGSLFPFAVAIAAIAQIVVLPIVGTIADHSDHKKRLMLGAAYGGSAFVGAMYFIDGSRIFFGAATFIFAAVLFGAAGVIYNSFLPDISSPELRDRVSAGGFAYGYAGGGIWLLANFVIILVMEDTAQAVRISLGATGLWIAVFLLFPQALLKAQPRKRNKPIELGWLRFAVKSTWATATEMKREYPLSFKYLLSYLVFNDGILTVITIAGAYAADELNAEASELLLLILMIQFAAVPGSILFGRAAEKYGSKKMLMATLVLWASLVIYAFSFLDSMPKLWAMGVVLALILGGSQSIARALYSQMIPRSKEGEYFGFFEIASRGTTWIGTGTFAIANQITGSQRQAILSLILFFLVGIVMLARLDTDKAIAESQIQRSAS